MKLSTRSRYGTRLMLDLAKNANNGPVQVRDIAERQSISVKYLEQLIIPLKKANLIKSVRGPKGGHLLAKPIKDIKVSDLIKILENDHNLSECVDQPDVCERVDFCPTRKIWKLATDAMYDALDEITLATILEDEKEC